MFKVNPESFVPLRFDKDYGLGPADEQKKRIFELTNMLSSIGKQYVCNTGWTAYYTRITCKIKDGTSKNSNIRIDKDAEGNPIVCGIGQRKRGKNIVNPEAVQRNPKKVRTGKDEFIPPAEYLQQTKVTLP